jgi:type IV pilus biogenesis protein CpaD/CtpE
MKTTKTSIRPSTLIFSCLAAFALASLAGCASDKSQSSTTESSSATMSPDTKDMTHQNSH